MSQYFNLELDTVGPSSSSISPSQTYYNSSASIPVSSTGASFMKLWVNTTAVGTTSDAEIPGSWSVYDTSYTATFSSQGNNYIHGIFVDDVGNQTSVINSTAVVFDNVAPTLSSVSINDGSAYTTSTSATVKVYFTDATSGIASATISGDFTGSPITQNANNTDRTNGYMTINITLTSAEGTKSVTATVTDRAGNTSSSKSTSIIYKTTAAEVIAVLKQSDGTTALGSYVNVRDFAVLFTAEDPADTAYYKLWGDFNTVAAGSATGTSEPDNWTAYGDLADKLVSGIYLTTGEGLKTIHAKVKSVASIVTTLDDMTVTYDITAPTISTFSSSATAISLQTGYTNAPITLTSTDTNGLVEYKIVAYASSAAATAGTSADATNIGLSGSITSGTAVSTTLTASALNSAVAGTGTKYLVAYVKDVAGNWAKSSQLAMVLDLTGPTGSITVQSPAEGYYNSQSKGFVASASDANTSVVYMQAWVDNTSNTTTVPASSTKEVYTATTESDPGYFYWNSVANGNAYVHIKYWDEVGNTTIVHSSAFTYDTVAPTSGSVTPPAYSNSRTVSVGLSASDATSGVAYVKLYGDIVNGSDVQISTASAAEWQAFASTASIKYTTGDGTKTVKAIFKDVVGNISSEYTGTGVYDATVPSVNIALYDATNTSTLGTHTNQQQFAARLSPEDVTSGVAQYKIYGDLGYSSSASTAIAENSATWQDFTYDAGQTYMSLTGLYFTTGDGAKTIYVKVKDNAGNVSTASSASITYDTTAPVINVANVDYNIISKVHTSRLNPSTAAVISGKYCDMMSFKFSCSEALRAYKVCVNAAGQTAAGATPIPTTGGSTNMSGGSVAASTDVNCIIMGADFATAVSDTDGAYEVIVYGQDTAGTWSAIHSIS